MFNGVPLTKLEYDSLLECQSSKDWDLAINKILDSRKGIYPSDWFEKIVKSGVNHQVWNKFKK